MEIELRRFASTKAEELHRLEAELETLASQAFSYVCGAPAPWTPYRSIPDAVLNVVREALGAGLFPDLPTSSTTFDSTHREQGPRTPPASHGDISTHELDHESDVDDLPLVKRQKLVRHRTKQFKPCKGTHIDGVSNVSANQWDYANMSLDDLLRQVYGAEFPPEPQPSNGRTHPQPPPDLGQETSTHESVPGAALPNGRTESNQRPGASQACREQSQGPVNQPDCVPASQRSHPQEVQQHEQHSQHLQQLHEQSQQQQQVQPQATKKRAPLWLNQMLPNRSRAKPTPAADIGPQKKSKKAGKQNDPQQGSAAAPAAGTQDPAGVAAAVQPGPAADVAPSPGARPASYQFGGLPSDALHNGRCGAGSAAGIETGGAVAQASQLERQDSGFAGSGDELLVSGAVGALAKMQSVPTAPSDAALGLAGTVPSMQQQQPNQQQHSGIPQSVQPDTVGTAADTRPAGRAQGTGTARVSMGTMPAQLGPTRQVPPQPPQPLAAGGQEPRPHGRGEQAVSMGERDPSLHAGGQSWPPSSASLGAQHDGGCRPAGLVAAPHNGASCAAVATGGLSFSRDCQDPGCQGQTCNGRSGVSEAIAAAPKRQLAGDGLGGEREDVMDVPLFSRLLKRVKAGPGQVVTGEVQPQGVDSDAAATAATGGPAGHGGRVAEAVTAGARGPGAAGKVASGAGPVGPSDAQSVLPGAAADPGGMHGGVPRPAFHGTAANEPPVAAASSGPAQSEVVSTAGAAPTAPAGGPAADCQPSQPQQSLEQQTLPLSKQQMQQQGGSPQKQAQSQEQPPAQPLRRSPRKHDQSQQPQKPHQADQQQHRSESRVAGPGPGAGEPTNGAARAAAAGPQAKPERKFRPVVPAPGPRGAQPVAPQPAAPQPEAPQPVAPQPVAPQPEAPQPVAPQPEAPQPVAPQLVVPQPVAPQPPPAAAGPRPVGPRVATENTHAELAAVAAALMAALDGDGVDVDKVAAAAAPAAADDVEQAGDEQDEGEEEEEEEYSEMDFSDGEETAADSCCAATDADGASQQVPGRTPDAGGAAGERGVPPTRPFHRDGSGSDVGQGADGSSDDGQRKRWEGLGGQWSEEPSSGGDFAAEDGGSGEGGASDDADAEPPGRSPTPDAAAAGGSSRGGGAGASEVEQEEWRRRQVVIERQRAEAAAAREAARRARAAQAAAAGAGIGGARAGNVVVEADLHRRMRQRLAEHHQLASAAAAEAAAKEELRSRIRAHLQTQHRTAIEERSLARLLKQLGALPKGALLRTAEQRSKALKAAKIRYHPDKATGSLEAHVYAEEVSKLLNSWDWT